MTICCKCCVQRGNFRLDLDLDMPANGITAVTGASGSGKTTLLRIIAGLDFLPGARVTIGSSIWQDGAYFLPVHKRAIGYVFQRPTLFNHLNVQSNINYASKRAPADKQPNMEQIIELLAIEPLLHRRPSQLSGGEQQRVAIARALAVSPQLLLMDEPLTSLDLQKRSEVLPFLESLRDQLRIPLIYVSHELDEIIRLADYMVVLNDGRVEAKGDVAQVLTNTELYIAKDSKVAAMIKARVIAQDKDYGLTTVSFAGGQISLVDQNIDINQIIRLRVAARDVSLSLAQPSGSSIMNSIETKVDTLSKQGNRLLVRLMAGKTPLLSLISRKSGDRMNLQPGKKVYAQIKTVALIR